MKDLITLKDWNKEDILEIVEKSIQIKNNPNKYSNALSGKNLIMIFEKPSLRTRLSAEIAINKLGGKAIYYDLKNSPLKKGETWKDTINVMSKYADFILARLFDHDLGKQIAKISKIPFINGLTDYCHPLQVLADIMTLKELFGKIKNLNVAYFGDANNNYTHSLIYGLPKLGINLTICCPEKDNYISKIETKYLKKIKINHDPHSISKQDIIMTDTWMSYHIPQAEKEKRLNDLKPFQVNSNIMEMAGNPYFMHLMPAYREYEVTSKVIDGKNSKILQQAENRLWTTMAVLLFLEGNNFNLTEFPETHYTMFSAHA